MHELYTQWWTKIGIPDTKCDNSEEKKESASELSFENVGGIFLVLAIGLIFALIVAILEFSWKAKQTSYDQVNNKI